MALPMRLQDIPKASPLEQTSFTTDVSNNKERGNCPMIPMNPDWTTPQYSFKDIIIPQYLIMDKVDWIPQRPLAIHMYEGQ